MVEYINEHVECSEELNILGVDFLFIVDKNHFPWVTFWKELDYFRRGLVLLYIYGCNVIYNMEC